MHGDRRLTSLRAQSVQDLHVLENLPSPELRRIARVAAHVARQAAGEPLAAIHLIDDDFQHRIAAAGAPLERTPVDASMCRQVVIGGDAIYTSDATLEPRFAGNPFVQPPDPVRLYYSTPLLATNRVPLGTLCVFATVPGALDDRQRARLDDLADQTASHLELAALSRQVAHLATHDPLTEVANRLLLSRRIQAALDDPHRSPHEPALLLVDLDDFKTINDTYGHQAGDDVLRSTAARLQAAVRGTDVVARLGGDEFAVLMPQLSDPRLLDDVAQRVLETARTPHQTSAGPVPCALSVGRTLGRVGDFAYELLGRADEDMYQRKRTRAQSSIVDLPDSV